MAGPTVVGVLLPATLAQVEDYLRILLEL